ncbi:hypothetical protein AWB77_04538 [Caballeronia fortuita]|uniref:Uncharacterized protein n=1 Tax=Caballeronia fortuita TaxID=1777138 RepID=A0A158CTY7_9BURK|nr:hypothetical protein [Caballeronia fortuita]SAK85842.1 hypothetical protein AWB77_04538 [Caballeronia fortuita]
MLYDFTPAASLIVFLEISQGVAADALAVAIDADYEAERSGMGVART